MTIKPLPSARQGDAQRVRRHRWRSCSLEACSEGRDAWAAAWVSFGPGIFGVAGPWGGPVLGACAVALRSWGGLASGIGQPLRGVGGGLDPRRIGVWRRRPARDAVGPQRGQAELGFGVPKGTAGARGAGWRCVRDETESLILAQNERWRRA